ncbi:partner of SLD five, PSF1 [Dictyocaulus viviparus]|uniref:DNA replication complex GINS protein PSF1 n=1 Tax=Dictyocaulus viviparus TaxID=29172 RepID=A0A0D8XHL0_DICVI|nr:partner of SLD five, PSF1 [Dictyocaulus viviparus]
MRVETESLEGVADQAIALLAQMKRSPDIMPPYNEAAMRICIAKMNELYAQNNECVTRLRSQGERASRELEALMICRNEALQLIRRCCLAYIHARAERIRSYRWRLGGMLPAAIKNNLCEAEIEFFNEYCSSLAEFQAGIGENGVNLLLSTHPPKALYVQVRVLENYGEFETSDGNLVMLQVNSMSISTPISAFLAAT